MQAFLVSAGVVALAEIGDKTQLLSLVLAARFRRPLPIVLGILAATLLNHGLAGALGAYVTTWLGPKALAWVLGASFLLMAAWILVPDKVDADWREKEAQGGMGIFAATVAAFFLAEMGDKTQIATVALAAEYPSLLAVVAGTTVGMLLANAPVVFLGDGFAKKIPLKLTRGIASALFAVMGILALIHGAGQAR
ncbi:MAG: TMEM165/GDT1 family protein [Fibrobacteria bacterium]